MMEENKGANPKLIVAVQMLSIGIILLILGFVVLVVSDIGAMERVIRLTFIISMGSIIFVGLCFAVGGILRYLRVKRA